MKWKMINEDPKKRCIEKSYCNDASFSFYSSGLLKFLAVNKEIPRRIWWWQEIIPRKTRGKEREQIGRSLTGSEPLSITRDVNETDVRCKKQHEEGTGMMRETREHLTGNVMIKNEKRDTRHFLIRHRQTWEIGDGLFAPCLLHDSLVLSFPSSLAKLDKFDWIIALVLRQVSLHIMSQRRKAGKVRHQQNQKIKQEKRKRIVLIERKTSWQKQINQVYSIKKTRPGDKNEWNSCVRSESKQWKWAMKVSEKRIPWERKASFRENGSQGLSFYGSRFKWCLLSCLFLVVLLHSFYTVYASRASFSS